MSRLRKNAAIGCFLFIFSLSYAQRAAAQERKMETDVVVVGFGGAGVSAAVSAAESGLQVIALEKHGVNFYVTQIFPHEPRVWHIVEDYGNAHHGAALIKRMVERANELGVTVMYKTPGNKLIYQNGAIRGVEAE
ncbi:FAD-binding protein [Brenneria populi]|uniref:FAD-binding protein n=1 Tax=Brenneria populi TaxID=1505588 RepID=A0ABU6JXX7_9GAMM|nr:FAD-binding protein [Brenneria populi Li et al. 2015]